MEICSNGHVIVRDDHSRFDYIPMAATKTISSVTIRAGTDIEAGDMLDDGIDVYSDSLEQKGPDRMQQTNSERYSIRDAEWVSIYQQASDSW